MNSLEVTNILADPDDDGFLVWKAIIGQHCVIGKIAGYAHIVRGEIRWTIQLRGRKYLRSHLVFALHTGRWVHPGLVLDHIDCNSMNDAFSNLREVTQKENMNNKRRPWGHMKT